MEFRIAPMILAVCSLLYITLANPDLNSVISLTALANYSKVLIPFGVMWLLSLATFFRHTFYSLSFRVVFWCLTLLSAGMLGYYIYAVEQQHL